MTHLPRLATLVFNRPHYITRDAGLAIANVVTRGGLSFTPSDAHSASGVLPEAATPQANRFAGEEQVDRDAQGRPVRFRGYRMFGATAIVNVLGELVNRGAWLGASSGLVSYEGLAQQLKAAAADPRAKRILLDVNSPGGEAAGMTEIAALVRKIAAEKPVVAVANSMMCSAAYGLCAGATRIVTTDLGVVGSIGVVMMHADYSGALGKAGIDVTLIHEGAHKVDGNPFEALPDDVRADFQSECAKYYAAFVDCVAAGRPGLTKAAIRSTEARTYLGREAVEIGLADAVGTFDEVLDDLERPEGSRLVMPARSSLSTAKTEEAPVTIKASDKPAAPAASDKTHTQADVDAAVAAAVVSATATSSAAGKAEGRAEERTRVKGILTHAAAEGRADLAAHLAFDTDMPVDAAAALLDKAPKALAAPAAPAASADTMMGLELAAPVATKTATSKVDSRSVYDRRKSS